MAEPGLHLGSSVTEVDSPVMSVVEGCSLGLSQLLLSSPKVVMKTFNSKKEINNPISLETGHLAGFCQLRGTVFTQHTELLLLASPLWWLLQRKGSN